MSSIFNALHIGYSGLKTSQVAIDTVGHNIANAENPYYTRQRVSIDPRTPLNTVPGDVGLGAKVTQIVRIHDEFVYKRLKDSSASSEYNQLRQDVLDQVSSYFPEIDKNGIYNGMQDYFNAWNDFAKNSDDSSLKINLAEQTRIFTSTIRETRDKLDELQKSLDDRLKTNIDEINRIGKDIAELNARINANEAGGNNANDLRDQRDKLELTLSKLIDVSVSKGELSSNTTVDSNLRESGSDYNLNIGGASFVDGATYHPIILDKTAEGSQYSSLYYERQDGEKFDITNYIKTGEVGAILSLRGSDYDQNLGKFTNGDIQNIIDELDSFANSLIVNTNNLYASHATTQMDGSTQIDPQNTLSNSDLPINEGSFYVKVYDIDGNEVAKREITLTKDMTFEDIAAQFSVNKDDNADNLSTNDIDDYLTANASNIFQISMNTDKANSGYTFAIEEKDPDNPTLFAGALGLERFLDGNDATNISLESSLDKDPTKISGNSAPVAGDNTLANSMVELQYKKVDFYINGTDKPYSTDTLGGFFRMSVTGVADVTASAHTMNETSKALLNSVVDEFDSISKVDIDEEMTNLMKYQTGYQASAKVITTIDQMIQTLLGMKQ
ncbi:flagellar hook-associated protein FlgK [Hydrogenimonas thermophila]|uniref:flagellar hook-associated protein FlgK n=1 Tax=Hydrogenimonas thermophila TaxID=223786 RepID=UPI002936E21D|nr:flagellar hook-associated protein FlgK [Hydrogenimonas thermophila]WOE68916.1 flagellar hook-associated protein FlgK [Hydrogenimonas thermophila]WOE71423.1 flagellar hook-associated protein FlgK [Hydrogenimonas thermophila]